MPGVIDPPFMPLEHIGLAGVAGEIYDKLRDEDEAFLELQAFLDVEELSDTDRALVGDEVSVALMESVIAQVAKCWPEIERRAAELERFPEKARPKYLG